MHLLIEILGIGERIKPGLILSLVSLLKKTTLTLPSEEFQLIENRLVCLHRCLSLKSRPMKKRNK
jgi:hypothetical protein